MNRFDGRRAFVTGAGHGIGRASASRLAAEGAGVVLADIDSEAATTASAELNASGASTFAVTCDVTDRQSVEGAVDSAVARLGGLEVLVCTAGGDAMALDPDSPDDDHWAAMLDLTLNLAARYAADGVRVNLIAPATVRTRVWDDQPVELARLTSLYPLGRAGMPDDIAAAVAFLASDDAAWITGITVPVDGGLLAAGPIPA